MVGKRAFNATILYNAASLRIVHRYMYNSCSRTLARSSRVFDRVRVRMLASDKLEVVPTRDTVTRRSSRIFETRP